MDTFEGRIAVVTGGGSGMGRELVVQLAAAGCSVAACDLRLESLTETDERARAAATGDARITLHQCDVSDRAHVERFRDEVVERHDTDHVNLVFNNAGISGGGSFINADPAEWERTFAVCWGGVYNCSRAFVPLLIASDDGYLVNTSSVNGFWASLGPGIAHTAYSSAKFAVRGFSESLIEDFRLHAPHVKVAVVMPGHIGTDIVANSRRAHRTGDPEEMTKDEIEEIRDAIARFGIDGDGMSDDDIRMAAEMMAIGFRDTAPLTAAEAATIILDGVRAGEWRILVGDDARRLDDAVRADPLAAYGPDGLSLDTILGVARGGG
jgi:NAD(P)-dependent dehydrogenase (short-subunit alcohol dehydrogenase family)